MKKTILSASLILTSIFCSAQFNVSTYTSNDLYWNSGHVGIGLDNPKSKLDIELADNFLYQDESALRITYNSPLSSPFLTQVNENLFEIREKGTFFGFNYFVSKMVVKTNGDVGIGISSPENKLQVHNGAISITGTNPSGGPMILFGATSTSSPALEWGIEYVPEQDGTSGLNFWKPWGSNGFGNHFLFLADNGKVSIGLDVNDSTTFRGDYKLYVGTGIMTEKVKVALRTTNDWADYVFKKDYDLMPISKVEAFIAENGHLPNVPSAKDVVENGIDIAKMDAKLLEKIEELTLYMIQLSDENKKMKHEIDILNSKLK